MTYLRKHPRQSRSRATFEAILEATARILVEDGMEAASTNRIAARAGVSIGSLYQYFSDRESIVRALLEQQFVRAEALRPAQIDDAEAPRAERLRAIVDWHVGLHASDPRLIRVLGAFAAKILPREEMQRFERLRHERTLRTVASMAPSAAVDLEVAVFVVETCLDALCDRILEEKPEWLREERLRRELTALLDAYLAR